MRLLIRSIVAVEWIKVTDIEVESGLTKPKPKKPRKQPVALPNTMDYDAAVAEAKQIIAAAESGRMRLGQLAAQVETEYGKESLKRFAKDTGQALCTLERSRSTWRYWEKIPAAPPKSYSVAEALQGLPPKRAAQAIKDKPNMSTREARKVKREYKKEQEQRNQQAPDSQRDKYRKWFTSMVEHFSTVYADAQIVNDKLDKKRLQILREVIDPNLVSGLRTDLEAAFKLVGFLERLSDEKDDARTRDGAGNHLDKARLT
jgi:hypothetical protein